MIFGFKQIALSTALAGLFSSAALAQTADNPFQRGRYTAVTERSQSAFDPEVVHVGTFELWTSLGLGAEYNSNIFAASKNADNETGDTIFRVQPQMEVRSNWSSHELNAGVSVDYRDYSKYETETVTSYDAFVGGRVDVLRTFQLNGRAFASHDSEQRYEPGSQGVVDPIEFDQAGANAGALVRRDRMQLEGSAGVLEVDYDSTANFRDVTETFLSGRGSYAISPDIAVFLQGRTADLDYDTATGIPNRDGTRSSVQAGASFELQAPFRGEIAVGSVKEEKDDPTQADVEGLSVDGNLMWFPTQLTTVTFRANRGIYDSGITQVASSTNTTWGLRVDHELQRNVILFGDITHGTYEFEGSTLSQYDRKDEFDDYAAGAAYKLNKRAHLEFGYRKHSQSSTGQNAGSDLEQHIFSIALRIFP